ncbi:MAG: N-acetylmuramoyl-L-alanine amidase [Candidatus Zixiibacteriota bacterium]
MKATNLIFWAVIIMISIVSSSAYAKNYVCIDPGHGGTDPGTHGRVYGVLEKDVNLGVGAWAYIYFNNYYWWPIMTRENDTTLSRERRADIANKANYGVGVDAFICIHHNASGDTVTPDTITNGTEIFWCNADRTDSNWARSDTTDTLATKVYFKLRDWLQYPERGVKLECAGRYKILKLTKMGSTISEASFLSCAEVERGFYFDFTNDCQAEAEAIFRGTVSYLRHAGIAIVKNSYSGGNAGELIISKWDTWTYECFATDTVYSPHTACWLGGMFGEAYCLQAISPQWIGGYQRTFHHWAHLGEFGDPIEISYDPLWEFEVPYWEQSVHRYVAYFSGGYSAQVVSPNGSENWHPGEQRDIVWNVSIGADSSTTVDMYLDRNSGNSGYPEHIGSYPAKWGNHYTWTVTGPYSPNCRIKVMPQDVAGNSAWDVSDHDFAISASGNNNPVIYSLIHCKNPVGECRQCMHWGESRTIEVHAQDPDGDSMYFEWWCLPSLGGHFPNGQRTITTAQNYVTYTAPTKAAAESSASGGDGQKDLFREYIAVWAADVRGGLTPEPVWGQPAITDAGCSCICGDVNGDLIVNAGDVIVLVSYLFKGGARPD